MQKTKVEIIEETVEYYKTNPRGVMADGGCAYLDETTGAKCAVGRCMETPSPKMVGCPTSGITLGFNPLDLTKDLDDQLIDFEASLKPEYRGHSPEFWDDLQAFHDGYYFWYSSEFTTGGSRLTDDGQLELARLLQKWKDQ